MSVAAMESVLAQRTGLVARVTFEWRDGLVRAVARISTPWNVGQHRADGTYCNTEEQALNALARFMGLA